MANVSQQIPNYLGGVSQASDIQKAPNEVDDIINGYPDPSFGLGKRNGSQFLNILYEVIIDTDTSFIIFKDKHSDTIRLQIYTEQIPNEQQINLILNAYNAAWGPDTFSNNGWGTNQSKYKNMVERYNIPRRRKRRNQISRDQEKQK